ncbi:MAG TPA: T9SS type A sorting domain-containing protein [bacterium]|nr:T9SS type A sorting domain-containing protein [bacterium]
MPGKNHLLRLMLFMLLICITSLPAGQAHSTGYPQGAPPAAAQVHINNLALWVQSDGIIAFNPYTQPGGTQIPWGLLYPEGIPVGLVYADGIIWGGMVRDGQTPLLRVGGSTWLTGLQPGAIIAPGLAEDPAAAAVNRIWRYRRDWSGADLTSEAFALLASRADAASRHFQFSPAELQTKADSLRAAYAKDRQEWPWQKGAPFYDTNHNGLMEEGEEPGLLEADQVVWFVANDLDPVRTLALYGSPPIGLEMQVTLWGYRQNADLANSLYRRTRVIYKGTQTTPPTAVIDSMAIGLYSDIDIGSWNDDLAGTDTSLQMIYGYNAAALDTVYQNRYSIAPPAFGYSLLYGPIVAGTDAGGYAVRDFRARRGFRNLPLTSSWVDRSGDTDSQPTTGKYDGTQQYYNVLSGFRPRPVSPPAPFRIPATGVPVRFSLTGDPVSGTGWLDENSGGREITCSSAYFSMARGDTQEVVMVMTAAAGANRLASVEAMKFFTRKAREYAGYMFVTGIPTRDQGAAPAAFQLLQNYPNPFNSGTVIRFDLPAAGHIQVAIYDLSGRRVTILVNGLLQAGAHSVRWDGTDTQGVKLPSGLFLVKLESDALAQTRKIMLMR